MTYQQTLDYLYQQLPMFQRVGPAAFKKDLGNIQQLCQYFKNPQNQFKSIHIAGTNGKGSVAHLLSSVLQAAGFKVGLYTSPHYRDFRERVKINGKYISQKTVIEFVQNNQSVFDDIQPSFFEITVAMAFQYFAQEKVDIAIIETGLGGRLDSTNILQPLLSIITNISFDHQQFLGDTLPLIASEKAGIIKRTTPVVIGEYQKEVADVFIQKAKIEKSALYFASNLIDISLKSEDLEHSIFEVISNKLYFHELEVNVRGAFQAKNIATTLAALQVLQKTTRFFGTKNIEPFIQNGFKDLKKLTRYKGRWQVISQEPLTICDSAHNEAGLKILFSMIEKMEFENLHFVYGTVADKDLSKVLPFFPQNATYYFAKANIPRGMDAKTLQGKAKEAHLKGRTYSSVRNALRAAKRNASTKDLIMITGSIFIVAEAIR